MFNIPATLPREDATALWRLQLALLKNAEELLGPRDSTKKIYQPIFDANGPHVINTPQLDGAFVALSTNAGGYWPIAIYEMAHETVHLLNPVVGYTTWLEEGVAVEFSIHAQTAAGLACIQTPSLASYSEALALVRSLPGGVFRVAHAVRRVAGALSCATVAALVQACPEIDATLAERLSQQCVPR